MDSHADYLNTVEFAHGIRFAVLILAAVVLARLTYYICTWVQVRRPPQVSFTAAENRDCSIAIAVGLNDAMLGSFPKLLYSQAKAAGGSGGSSTSLSCCSICLSEYKETDVLRMLPGCGHCFHLKCVDAWLRLNPSCPSCRNSLVPIPAAKLPAEAVPLAAPRL